MKLLMILGGLIGFSIGICLGLSQGAEWPTVLWRASVAALLAGVVLRWWARVWVRNFEQALKERTARSRTAEPVPAATQAKP
jgi:hypothetical protein